MRSAFYIFWIILISACSSPTVVKLPLKIERFSKEYEVELKGLGQLFVVQAYNKDLVTCKKLRGYFYVEMEDEKGKTLKLRRQCKGGKLRYFSKRYLKPGKYTVEVVRGGHSPSHSEYGKYRKPTSLYYFKKVPTLYVHHKDPELDSGADQTWNGAIAMEPGKGIEEKVNYTEADHTDWIQLKGKNSSVTLNFIQKPKARDSKAFLFRATKNRKKLKYVARLIPNKSKKFRLLKDDLYIRVKDAYYTGNSPYEITRKDSPIARKLKVSVIDCYEISDHASIVLLRKLDSLKVDAAVSVFGKGLDGKVISLGQCHVTSTEGNQARCLLDRPRPAQITEYRAELILEG